MQPLAQLIIFCILFLLCFTVVIYGIIKFWREDIKKYAHEKGGFSDFDLDKFLSEREDSPQAKVDKTAFDHLH